MFSRATITLHHHLKSGAGDGIRTRDLLLGKQMLYQLSYPRIAAAPSCPIALRNVRVTASDRVRWDGLRWCISSSQDICNLDPTMDCRPPSVHSSTTIAIHLFELSPSPFDGLTLDPLVLDVRVIERSPILTDRPLKLFAPTLVIIVTHMHL